MQSRQVSIVRLETNDFLNVSFPIKIFISMKLEYRGLNKFGWIYKD